MFLLLGFIGMAIVLTNIHYDTKMRQAVKGSHERFVLATKRRIFSWAANLSFVVLGIGGFYNGYWFTGVVNTAGAIFFTYLELKRDEDDWFNGRWKKIKRGVKKYVESLSAGTSGAVSPAGA